MERWGLGPGVPARPVAPARLQPGLHLPRPRVTPQRSRRCLPPGSGPARTCRPVTPKRLNRGRAAGLGVMVQSAHPKAHLSAHPYPRTPRRTCARATPAPARRAGIRNRRTETPPAHARRQRARRRSARRAPAGDPLRARAAPPRAWRQMPTSSSCTSRLAPSAASTPAAPGEAGPARRK